MAEAAILDIELDFLKRLKQADQSLESMIKNANRLTESLTKAFNSASGSNIDLISRMAEQWEALGSKKLRLDVDTTSIEKLTTTLDNTIQVVQAMAAHGFELFDTDKVYETKKGLAETSEELNSIIKQIETAREVWGKLGKFEVPTDDYGNPYDKDSDEYQNAKAMWDAAAPERDYQRAALEAEIALLLEKRAIAAKEKKWAKMTQDERVEYVKKKLNEILKDEQSHNNAVIAEYRKTITEMLGIMRETDRLNKKNEGGVIDPEIQQLNARFAQLNQERIAMEENYGAIIVKVAEESNAKAVKIYAERKLTEERLRKDAEEKEWQAYLSSPEGALQLASDAKTINEMRDAQKYLQVARGNVDVKNTALIKQLNDAYTSLRITIENLTTAEKNEQSLQPTIRNEYVRLLKELEKVQEARLRLSDTDAFANSDPKAESDYNALLIRERDIQAKIRQIRENSNGLLEEADNQYRADKAQRDLVETERVEKEKTDKIRARYKEVLDELRQLGRESNRIEDLENKYGDDFESSNAINELRRRQQDLNDERLIIEGRYQDKISDIQDEEGKKRVKDEVDRAERAARLSVEARKRAEEKAEKDRGTYRGAMAYSRSTTSIKEQTQAIKYLKEARESLNRGDFRNEKEYRKALNAITLEIDRQEKSIKNLKLETEKINPISSQLKTAMTNVFGVAAVKGYVNQLIRIRGEFELQQRSLQVLLRNKDEANRLWEQTIELAVKSPYRVDELVTATKQLAAYRVEANKLHSTTQMLADLSSGLGVDIQRLILAFGQVKAANFLRGTELRQFSEAGINILDELAEHYSNLEGRIVSVGDVFDRVSKRMVSFADVETVLQGMTGEGGQFYKMQEQQAETLRGQVMNLKDSVLLMYNEIGEMSDGVLKGSIAFIRDIIENWKSYANIIATVVGAMAGYKSIVLLSRVVMASYNLLANAAAVVTVKFGNSATWAAARVRLLNRAMNANPVLRFISIVTGLIAAIGGLFISFDKTNESAKSHVQILDESAIAAKNAAAGIKELTDERNELLKVESLSEEQEKRLNDVTSARNRLLGELAEKNQEYAKSLKLAGDDGDKMADAIDEQNAKIEAQLSLAYKLSKVDWEKSTDAKRAETTKIGTSAVFKSLYNSGLELEGWVAGTPSSIIVNAINDSQGDIEVAIKKMFDNLYGYTREEQIKLIKGVLAPTSYGEIVSDYLVAEDLLSSIVPTLENDAVSIATTFAGTARGEVIKNALQSTNEEIKNNALTELQGYFKKEFISQAIPDTAQDEVKKAIAKAFGLEDGWFDEQITKQLNAWQKGYNALLDALTKGKNIPSLTPVTATTDIKDQVRLLNELKEEQEAIMVQYADQQKYKVMLPMHSKEDADNAKLALYIINELLKALGQLSKGGRSRDTRYTNLIKVVNDVYSAFDKLEEKFDKITATEMLWRDYSDAIDTAFKKVGKSADWVREQFGDLTDKQSLKSALDWIAQNASTKEARLQAQTASAKISVDLEIEARDKEFDELTRQMDDLFSGYELSIELDKLHIPKDFAKDFFNLDSIDITELRKRVVDKQSEFKGTEGEKAYKDYLDKLDEMEVKSQQERLKKYLEFSREAIGERAKIMLDGFYELQDIEKAFQMTNTLAFNKGLISEKTKTRLEMMGKTISDLFEMDSTELAGWQLTKEDLATLKEFNEELERQAQVAGEASKKKVSEELNKMDWEAFRGSDTFQTLFNDLEGASEQALDALIKHLEKYKDQWSSLPLGQMKSMVKLLEQAKEAQAGLVGPMEGLRNARAKMAESGYSDRGTAEADLFSSEQRIAELDHELAVLAEVQRLKDEGYTDLEIFDTLSSEDASIAMTQTKDNAETLKGEQEKISSSAKQYLDNLKKIPKYYNEIRERATKVKQMTDKVFDGWDAVNELFEEGSMSQELAELVSASADIGFEAFNSVQMFKEAKDAIAAGGTQAEIFGHRMNAALGIIGLIVSAIQIIAKVLKFAFEQHDKSLQKQIDAQLLKIKELQDAYEDLEKQIEKAYTAVDLGKLTKDATNKLNAQIKATEDAIALEEDKKKTDEDAISDWKDDIRDMRESIEELQEETFSTLTDGILDDVLDATRGFVDAWHDAYEETGDGMKGLEEYFTDMLRNVLRQQASMQLISPFIKKYKEWLSEYVNEDDDPTLTASEASAWAERVRATFPELNELLKGFFEGTQGLLETGGELSDLEKGIQGMTEDQAEVLAAYWNSCRFILANIDSTLTQMASATLGGVESNPMLSELRAQTELIRSISNLFSSVVGYGESNHSGAYLKVLMS